VDENPFLGPKILLHDGFCDGNHAEPIKPPMLFGDGVLSEED